MGARLSASESASDITPEYKQVRPCWIAGMRHARPFDNYRITIANAVGAVPEPSTWAMMLIGFGAVGASLRRRRVSAIAQMA
jgi:hypothetical protein